MVIKLLFSLIDTSAREIYCFFERCGDRQGSVCINYINKEVFNLYYKKETGNNGEKIAVNFLIKKRL